MAEFKYRKKRKEFKEQARVRNNDYREIALTKMGKRQLMLTLLSIFGVTLLSIGSTLPCLQYHQSLLNIMWLSQEL